MSPSQSQQPHPRSAACSIFGPRGHACGYSPSSKTHEFFWTYAAQVERLREIFPRGRFKRDVDDTAILVPRSRRWAGCHLYEQDPGRLVGLSYSGSSQRVTQGRLAAYVVKHLGGDGEGTVHLRWDAGLARVLPTFSRPAQRGVGAPFGKRETPAMADTGAVFAEAGAASPPPVAQEQGALAQGARKQA